MTGYLVVEHDQQTVHPSFFNVLQASQAISHPVVAIVLGTNCKAISEEIAMYQGVSKVINIDNCGLKNLLVERCAPLIVELVEQQDAVLVGATSFGKNLMPRIAALLATPQVSEVTDVLDSQTFRHPIYAGNVLETVKYPPNHPVCLTIRPTAFKPMQCKQDTPAPIVFLEPSNDNFQSERIDLEQKTLAEERPTLNCASVVISGGRGLQAEGFKKIIAIANRLGAAVGATRAAVDSGLAPNDWQVGQTGQVVAPRLYFAVGISGAIQHVAGMKDSQIIVAINKDSDAPIFQLANYGLVADLGELLPEWELALTEMGY